MGVKRIIKCDDVKVVDVPQFEGLAIKDIFDFACNSTDVENALPPPKEISKLSRSYLSNVIYTVMGEPFQAGSPSRSTSETRRWPSRATTLSPWTPRSPGSSSSPLRSQVSASALIV